MRDPKKRGVPNKVRSSVAWRGPSMFVVEHETGTIRDASGQVVVTADPNGSMRDASRKVVLFSKEAFVKDICLGKHCFICGVSPEHAEFNNEHIIPRWILDFTNQRAGKIQLPNQTLFHGKYGGYTIPCCVSCNTGLSDTFENVLAPLFTAGYKSVRQYLVTNGPTVIFRWLALMFLKTHLRDARLAWERNDRKKIDTKIGDLYNWEALHHVHCISRSYYAGIDFDSRRIGSMLIMPAELKANNSNFDYAANYHGRSVMIRVGEIVCFAVLNDASIVQSHFPRALKLATDGAALTPMQIRELHCEFTWRNWCLETRPRFATVAIPQPHFETLMPPNVEFAPKPVALPNEEVTYGDLLHHACSDFIESMPEEQRGAAEAAFLSGTATWFKDDVPYWPVSETADETPTKKPRKQTTSLSPPRKTREVTRRPKTAASNAKSKGTLKRAASPPRAGSAPPKLKGGKLR